MEITIPEIIKEHTLMYGIGVTIALIGVAIKTIKGLFELYEELVIRRYLNRLGELSKGVNTDSTASKYINILKENEVFRLASGITASPEKSVMLMDVYLLGIISNSDLKRVSLYLKPDNNLIKIKVSYIDKILFTYSYISGMFLFLSGMIMGFPYFITEPGSRSFAGLIIMIVFFFMGMVVSRDYRSFRILKGVKEKLIEKEKISNPDKSIQWGFTRWFRR